MGSGSLDPRCCDPAAAADEAGRPGCRDLPDAAWLVLPRDRLSRALRYFGIVFLGIRYGDSALDFAAGNLPLVAVGCASLIALFVTVRQLSNRWLNR